MGIRAHEVKMVYMEEKTKGFKGSGDYCCCI